MFSQWESSLQQVLALQCGLLRANVNCACFNALPRPHKRHAPQKCNFSCLRMWLRAVDVAPRQTLPFILIRAGNKRRLTKITPFKRYVYGTVRLNRPNKGVNFGRSVSSKDGRPFLDVQASTATEMARLAVEWTKLLFPFHF